RLITPQNALEILKAFLETSFAGGRHERRVNKLNEKGQR
ncbi:MAG: RpiB/LacA/LacB family sugar-phosphate isomerase, partial [Bdellovibrionales bacterium]|nr:RpiB/LacA/LacB family sugar-phosphate isomerase [Bdellovibrionales bacterium]